ncbi:hypothetical protein DMH08_36325 [Actinomadura sp. WAC 06369]|nr:hypothetical protein DMH08_36325 [Actinomadura sp. WAC 06369]
MPTGSARSTMNRPPWSSTANDTASPRSAASWRIRGWRISAMSAWAERIRARTDTWWLRW